jgi:hypothetical protein
MEAAMEFLAETDIKFAEAKVQLLHSEILAKRSRARVYVTTEGAVELRKATVEGHADVIEADSNLCQATLEFETLKARRSRAEIVIDVFRTLEASRRKT